MGNAIHCISVFPVNKPTTVPFTTQAIVICLRGRKCYLPLEQLGPELIIPLNKISLFSHLLYNFMIVTTSFDSSPESLLTLKVTCLPLGHATELFDCGVEYFSSHVLN